MMRDSISRKGLVLGRTRFETRLQVRPDDIDMFQHVHSSRYQDYVLAARYDQMSRCYRMSMEAFLSRGWGWFVREFTIQYKHPLKLAEEFLVRTWVDDISRAAVRVQFEIAKTEPEKTCCLGHARYLLIQLESGRMEKIPDWVARKYAV